MIKKFLLLSIGILLASPIFNVKADTYYTVKQGDTLWGIASNNKISITSLMNLNNLKNPNIYSGENLLISKTSNDKTIQVKTTSQSYTVKVGDTLWSISRMFNVAVNDIIRWNNLPSTSLSVGQVLTINGTVTTTQTPTGSTAKSVYAIVYGCTSLNLRDNPNGNIIGTIPSDTQVQILSSSNGWNKVQYGNITGWASIHYLKLATQTSSTSQTTSIYATVKTNALNLRTSPNGSIVTVMPNGTSVQVLQTSNGWTQVKYGNTVGWAYSAYLTVNSSNSQTSTSVGSKRKTVLLDPGHGGADSGAVNGSYYEKYLTMTFVNKTKSDLENMGYTVYVTRSGDNSCLPVYSLTPDLQCRVDKAKADNADIFVSIHMNSSLPGAIGSESFYNANNTYDGTENAQPDKSKLLAQLIQNRYQPVMGSTNRGTSDCSYYVLRKNTVPATLLEIGFISDYRDLNKLINTTYQNNISMAIANGINDFFNKIN